MTAKGYPGSSFVAAIDDPLIGVIVEEEGKMVVRYFTDDAAADAAMGDRVTKDAHSLAGVWSDLDWDEMIDELDRIRHESKPTPPIDEL